MFIEINNYQVLNNHQNQKLIVNFDNKKKNLKPLKCFSGGGLIIINDKFIPVIKRTKNATTNKNKITTPSGLADNLLEIYNPEKLNRELFEEIVLIKNKKIINFTNFKNKSFLTNKANNLKLKYLKKNEIELKPRLINHKIYKSLKYNNHELILNYQNKKQKKIKCFFHISSNRNVNIFFIYNLNINIKNLFVYDTEFMDKITLLKPRKIYIIDKMKKNFYYNNEFKDGKYYENLSCTDHLLSIINNIRKI